MASVIRRFTRFPVASSPVGQRPIRTDDTNADENKLGIQSLSFLTDYVFQSLIIITDWAEHGICGRGVLLDLVRFYAALGRSRPYDPMGSYAITAKELEACAKAQGVSFRTGDILFIRAGFMERWYASSMEERNALPSTCETL
jgi:hypothetical protein